MKKRVLIVLCIILALCMSMCLIACNPKQELVPTNIAYDGETITWDKVDLAGSYLVKINDGSEQKASTNRFSYNAGGQDFTVEVFSVVGKKKISSDKMSFKAISKLSNDSIAIAKDGTINWQAVPGATAYKIRRNGVILNDLVYDTSFSNFESGKTNAIQILPIVDGDNSCYSSWSDIIKVNILSQPTDIKYNSTKGIISWRNNSHKSRVVVKGATTLDVELDAGVSEVNYASANQDFEVSITSLGDASHTYDSKVTTEAFYYLDSIKELSITEGILSWQEVPNADMYTVEITSGTNITYKDVNVNQFVMEPGKQFTYRVMPVSHDANKHYFSSWSIERDAFVLNSPVLHWNTLLEDGLSWDPVNGVANNSMGSYSVKVTLGNNIIHNVTGIKDVKYENAYSSAGKYKVEVQAVVDDANFVSSQPSVVEITRLSAPTNININSDRYNIDNGYSVQFDKVPGAVGYELYRGDGKVSDSYTNILRDTSVNTVAAKVSGTTELPCYIRSVAGVVNPNEKLDKVTLSSLRPSEGNTLGSFNISIAAIPQNPRFEGFNMVWDTTSCPFNYAVYGAGDTINADTESCNLDAILHAGNYNMSVVSRGDGAYNLPSVKSVDVAAVRLNVPKDIKIARKNNGTIDCSNDFQHKISSYTAKINGVEETLVINNHSNLYDRINCGSNTTIAIRANYNAMDGSVYYMSSEYSKTLTITKLTSPTFPSKPFADGNYLKWNAPQGFNNIANLQYEVWKTENEMYTSGVKTGTEFDISGFEPGKYDFFVKALGNGVDYIDSDFGRVTATKLDTPVFTVANNGYNWAGTNQGEGYELKINGEKKLLDENIGGKEYYYHPTFTTQATHAITLQAIGDGVNTINSNIYEYRQQVSTLSVPQFSAQYSADTFATNNTVDVVITQAVPYADGYVYKVGGVDSINSEEVSTTNYSKKISTPCECGVQVKAKGDIIDVNEIYWLDSNYSTKKLIYILAAPLKPTKQGTAISFESYDSKTTKYEYVVMVGNKTSKPIVVSKSEIVDLAGKQFEDIDGNTFQLNKGDEFIVKVRSSRSDTETIRVNYVKSEWTTSDAFIW